MAKKGIKFRFRVTLSINDVGLICALKNYFNAGTLSLLRLSTNCFTLEINNIETIKTVIIPFFEKYPLKGTKYFDFIYKKKV